MGSASKIVTVPKTIIPEYLARNREAIGNYFSQLAIESMGEWECWALGVLVRSRAYARNDIEKLLELAQDIRRAHQAQIDFVEKYVGDLFDCRASKVDREIDAFLNKKVIPSLKRLKKGREA